ncbi:MAG: phospholipase [Alphaproteobacteria bacterium]|nr:phospholipase [Alphaproteobacteria bacterium]MBU0799186.1 phospholipase [Alphaproteobacteria bacterium]MBU0887977.1 phospholipase [Alphaproteobacteria bacterium]MBU1814800.1 phospholipase [Alphaproteobacteria bacterium]MBU2091176.1 phospholipase [Alphaproteobacteria bacterium]
MITAQTCWRTETAERARVLIDGAAYFQAVREAMLQAEHSIHIIGWDFDHRSRLFRDGNKSDGSLQLGSFLRDLAKRRPGMSIRILRWGNSVLLNLGRELKHIFRLGWSSPRNIHYHRDLGHPFGATHHQKLIIIDDRVAFCGSLDLVEDRWDTPEHLEDDPRRRLRSGDIASTRHEVAMMVQGAVARALGDLFRERWLQATGYDVSAFHGDSDPWPPSIQPDFRRVKVAIARTMPVWRKTRGCREVEAFHLAAIRHARRYIYIENQYLAGRRLLSAICERLAEADGPEIVILNPENAESMMEEASMGAARAYAIRLLRDADVHGHLALYRPVSAGGRQIYIHSKVLIFDDSLLKIGSSNLNNRSMGFDTECDLVIESDSDEATSTGIADIRAILLAEHLGCAPDQVSAALEEKASLIQAIESLRKSEGKRLEILDSDLPINADSLLHDLQLLDPEAPARPFRLAKLHLARKLGLRRARYKPSGKR